MILNFLLLIIISLFSKLAEVLLRAKQEKVAQWRQITKQQHNR